MSKGLHICVALLCAATSHIIAEETALKQVSTSANPAPAKTKQAFQPFTGKILGTSVRLRTEADVDSHVVKELEKGQLVVILGEKNDFYAVEPLKDTKAYIFRSFVLDNMVEGNRVNIRLSPEIDAPIIAHLSTGDKIDGKVSDKNNKWLEIVPPAGTKFYVAKEFIDYVGGPELKAIHDRKQESALQLVERANLLMQSELRKPFEEIDYDRLVTSYQTIIHDYQDFPQFIEEAKTNLASVQETYLQKKLGYLESKASIMDKAVHFTSSSVSQVDSEQNEKISATDRMKVWEPIEKGLYLTWSGMHHAKTMKDFYEEQKMQATVVSGILESYIEPVKQRPGDYILREKGIPVAYVYSTHINLHQYVGRQVNLVSTTRPNNHFAFPAYFVLEVE
ncbi:MAG: hypothetical protein HY860_02245 [Chlamydiales bacterium]|nr:hypothetical protein [Chlamydiales bacterium]